MQVARWQLVSEFLIKISKTVSTKYAHNKQIRQFHTDTLASIENLRDNKRNIYEISACKWVENHFKKIFLYKHW